MLERLFDRDALLRILGQQLSNEVDADGGDVLLKLFEVEIGLLMLDLIEGLLAIVRVEGELLADHCIENHAARPQVHLRLVSFFD